MTTTAGMCTDETQLRLASRVVDQVGDGVAVVDNDGWFLLVNPAFAALHGCAGEDLTGQHFTIFYSPENQTGPVQALIAAALRDGVARAELVRRRRDGSPFPARVALSLLHDEDGELIGRVLVVQDVTDRSQLEEQLRRQALHDPLTGLANRRLLHDRLTHALARAARRGTQVAVLFLDVDAFKTVNDTLGHAAGDQVLVEVAARLAAHVRPQDTVARYGGDEFVVVVDDVTDPAEPQRLADRLRSALAPPLRVGPAPLTVTASIGVALAQDGTADQLLAAADSAMYRAKADPQGFEQSPGTRAT